MYNFINTTSTTIAGFSRGHCEVYVCVWGGGVTVHHEPSIQEIDASRNTIQVPFGF